MSRNHLRLFKTDSSLVTKPHVIYKQTCNDDENSYKSKYWGRKWKGTFKGNLEQMKKQMKRKKKEPKKDRSTGFKEMFLKTSQLD